MIEYHNSVMEMIEENLCAKCIIKKFKNKKLT